MKRMAGIIVSTTLITWQNISAAELNQIDNSIENNRPITVYCVGNHDLTGTCFSDDEESSKSSNFDCVITSWPIVNCKNMEKEDVAGYSCIALGNTNIQNQVSLSCEVSKPVSTAGNNNPTLNGSQKLQIPPVSSDISEEAHKHDSSFFGEAFQ